MKQITTITITIIFSCTLFAQQPNYKIKKFVSEYDTAKFLKIIPEKNGFFRTFIIANPQIWDLDDDSTTFIKAGVKALLCIEGNYKNKLREGKVSFFLIDSFNNEKRYKIWEQSYSNDKLNGKWITYTLRGTILNFKTYQNDSLNGISRDYWIDQKTIMDEIEYFNGQSKYVQRHFYSNGNLKDEISYLYNKLNGRGRKFYEDGTLQEEVNFANGDFDGPIKYFYPNGNLWTERIYKLGKCWKVIANLTSDGKKRDPGTLSNGNGTVIYYNEDGSIREIEKYTDGILQK